MAIIGDPEKVWELPAPLDIPSDTPLESDEIEKVKSPEKEVAQ